VHVHPAGHQLAPPADVVAEALPVGDLVRARVVGSEGVDLVAELVEVVRASDDRPSSRKVAVSA